MPPEFVPAAVHTSGLSLYLRAEPGPEGTLLTYLPNGTALHVIGRTEDYGWYNVRLADNEQVSGWVTALYVATAGPLHRLPSVPSVGGASPAFRAGDLIVNYPYITNIRPRIREIYAQGQQMGNRPDVFSKVGDSLTISDLFLKTIGVGHYDLGPHVSLQPVITFFSVAVARDHNSFANTSLAAKSGWSVWNLLEPEQADEDLCFPGETPLNCEFRHVKPAYALIMVGTNDVPGTSLYYYEARLREIVTLTIDHGVIPIISTIPDYQDADYQEKIDTINGIIIQVAEEYQIPLWHFNAALVDLTDKGLTGDGIHLSVWSPPANFNPYFMDYGMNVRNLTALQALDAVWRYASVVE